MSRALPAVSSLAGCLPNAVQGPMVLKSRKIGWVVGGRYRIENDKWQKSNSSEVIYLKEIVSIGSVC